MAILRIVEDPIQRSAFLVTAHRDRDIPRTTVSHDPHLGALGLATEEWGLHNGIIDVEQTVSLHVRQVGMSQCHYWTTTIRCIAMLSGSQLGTRQSGAEPRDFYDAVELDSYIARFPRSREKDHHCGYQFNWTFHPLIGRRKYAFIF